MSYLVTIQGTTYTVSLDEGDGRVALRIDGRPVEIDMVSIQGDQLYSLLIEGRSYTAVAATGGEQREVRVNGVSSVVTVEDEQLARLRGQVKSRRRAGANRSRRPCPAASCRFP